MLGIQMAFVGLFGAVLQPVTSDIITQYGWRTGYFFVGGITFAVVVAASLVLLKNKPGDKHLLPLGAESASEDTAAGRIKKRPA